MPEIAEVARIVHYCRKHLVSKTLTVVKAQHDENVFGKVGTSGAEFEKALKGRKVVDAGQQGKYFWLVMEKKPHPLMHFGMAGWLKIKDEHTYYYKTGKGEEETKWPPKYWKFLLETDGSPKTQAAFVDMRRFARVRLLDCTAEEIRKTTPLVENGPDPVIDKAIVTEEWLTLLCKKKHVPIKALLLDQANISGIGNWVGDEIMYNAKIHPEQYSDTLTDPQFKQLHKSIHYICGTACDLLADSDQFPEEWLFKHRWGKGKKDHTNTLPNGEKIVHMTVGGRTSAVVPSVQKKTGPVAGDLDSKEADGTGKPQKGKKRKSKDIDEEEEDETSAVTNGSAKKAKPKPRKSKFKEELSDEDAPPASKPEPKKRKSEKTKEEEDITPAKRKGLLNGSAKPKQKSTKTEVESGGKRRSKRLSSD